MDSSSEQPGRSGRRPPPAAEAEREVVPWLGAPPMRYPSTYVWLVFVSALDVMMTWAILLRGGTEVNPIAKLVIDTWELPGAIAFKFSLMLFVIVVCEAAGRESDRKGYALARIAVVVSALPVAYSLGLLFYHDLIFSAQLGGR